MANAALRRTPLYGWHAGAGGRMVEYAGWEMPIQYPSGPREEHLCVRRAAGLFDVSHMGRLRVSGLDALAYLQRVQSWDASRIVQDGAHYAMLLNETAGIIDDILIYRLGGPGLPGSDAPRLNASTSARRLGAETDEVWLVVVNASNREKDWRHLLALARDFDVTLGDQTEDTGMIAVQGPAARRILASAVGPDAPLVEDLGYHRARSVRISAVHSTVAATGYTGEPGYELVAAAEQCEELWRSLLAHGEADGLRACGLAARDSLRAEACLPLYGHEIDESIDPVSAGLQRAAVAFDGHEFIGKQALLAIRDRGPVERIVGFQMIEPGVPRQGYPVISSGKRVGTVTTGLFGPSTGRYLGMARVEASIARAGTAIRIVIRGAEKEAQIVERPFYRSPHWR